MSSGTFLVAYTTSLLTLGPHKGPPWVVAASFSAITRWEFYAVNKLFN